jgi:hypothetical protein
MKNTISDIARLLGKRGGLKTKQSHAPDYYKNLGAHGASIRWGETETLTVFSFTNWASSNVSGLSVIKIILNSRSSDTVFFTSTLMTSASNEIIDILYHGRERFLNQ